MSLTPSTSHLWVPCSLAGPVNCSTGHSVVNVSNSSFEPDEDEDTEARREGRAAHWIAERVLRGDASCCEEMLGETAPNGWLVTPDMVRHCQGYVDLVNTVAARPGTHAELLPEMPSQIIAIDPVTNLLNVLVNGRSDAIVISDDPVLHIFDLKYGRRIVEAERNWPMLCHAVSAWNVKRHQAVIMTVVQPRQYHPDGAVRSWTLTGPEFEEYARFLLDRARQALGGDPIGTPGEHCRDCAGAAGCYALARSTYAARQVEEDRRFVRFTAAEASQQLAELEFTEALVKARRKALAGEIEGRMKTGEWFPDRHMRNKRGDRKFTVDAPVRELMTGIPAHKKVERSPAEMENEGALNAVMEAITTRPFAGRELAVLTKKDVEREFKDHPLPSIPVNYNPPQD